MTPFEFSTVTRIIFGRGQFARIGELAAPLGQRALIVYNGSESLLHQLQQLLSTANIPSTPFRQKGEPTVDDIDRALATARQNNCDLVLALGGGSAIDAAKAVAGLLTNGGSLLDYLEVVGKGQKISRPAAPWIAIPTTAGTGAEVTKNAVIGYPPRQMKASIRSDLLLARIALIDPELARAVPADVTARCGMDALCQLIEGYTSTGATPFTDALALEGLTRAARSLHHAFTHGNDLDAREDMALAALLSGSVLANAGLGAAHGLAAPLGAAFPIPHGTACAILLPLVMSANVTALRQSDVHHPALTRYATLGRTLTANSTLDDSTAIQADIDFAQTLCRNLQIPTLRPFGLTESAFPAIIALAQKSSSMRYNPTRLSDQSLASILRQAL